jgi:hypothetical protein
MGGPLAADVRPNSQKFAVELSQEPMGELLADDVTKFLETCEVRGGVAGGERGWAVDKLGVGTRYTAA